jgi:hypothetical protein
MTGTTTKTHQVTKRCHHQHPQNSATRQHFFKPSPSRPVGVHHPRSKGSETARFNPQTPGCRVNRYYNTATATFMTVDPLVAQTMQAYSYAADNPLAPMRLTIHLLILIPVETYRHVSGIIVGTRHILLLQT